MQKNASDHAFNLRYIKALSHSKNHCNRVLGLQKLEHSRLRYPSPVFITENNSFEFYRKYHHLPKKMLPEINTVFAEIQRQHPHRGVYVGRAYYVPNLSNPPGPRSSSVTSPEIVIKNIIEIYDFAIKNHYVIPGSQMGCILYPFISPTVPYGGGSIHPLNSENNTLCVEAIYGVDEGIQSLPHDTYLIDARTLKVRHSQIGIKKYCLVASSSLTYQKITVPIQFQKRAVCSESWLYELARDYMRFEKQYGEHRLEFAMQLEGIYFRECVPYESSKNVTVHTDGIVQKINSNSHMNNMNNGMKKHILFVDPEIILHRKMDIITELAFMLSPGRIILYPGTASTAHAATILREKGHHVVFVKNQQFQTGEQVRVVSSSSGDHVIKI